MLRPDGDDVSDSPLLRRGPQRRPQELPQHVRHLLRLQMNHLPAADVSSSQSELTVTVTDDGDDDG